MEEEYLKYLAKQIHYYREQGVKKEEKLWIETLINYLYFKAYE